MRMLRRLLLAVAAAGALLTTPAQAEGAEDLTITVGFDWASKYLWRGLNYNDDAVLYTGLTLGYQGFELGILGIINFNDMWGRENNYEEVRYSLSYTHEVNDDLTVVGGLITYYYPGFGGTDFNDETEVFVSLVGTSLPFKPTLTAYYEFRDSDGWFFTLGGEHSFDLSAVHEHLSLVTGIEIGWINASSARSLFGVDDSGFAAVSPSVALRLAASERLTFDVYTRYDYMLDDDFSDAHRANIGVDTSVFSFGTSVIYTF